MDSYSSLPNFNFSSMNFSVSGKELQVTSFTKLRYLAAVAMVKKIIKQFKPDLIHSHYATSFGLIGVLSGYHPHIVSVWGSDVFQFPIKSVFHKFILKYIFSKADKICSTSKVMSVEINKYSNKEILITPFGVDTNIFKPMNVGSIFNKDEFVIGTIKNLKPIYGIDKLIMVFGIIKQKWPELPIKLLIVGNGPQETFLKGLVKKLKLYNHVIFTGNIENTEVYKYYNMMDIVVFLSVSESYGVAALEASSCGKPVVVSDAYGFNETVVNEKTGIVVDPNNLEKVAEIIKNLLEDRKLRKIMGSFGIEWVNENFDEKKLNQKFIDLYQSTLQH